MIGQLVIYAKPTVPDGYLLCDGSIVLKSSYSDLYTAIGDAYGTIEDSGGTVYTDGAYTIRKFTGNGTFVSKIARNVEVLIVRSWAKHSQKEKGR